MADPIEYEPGTGNPLPPPDPHMTVLAFASRFTAAEQVALDMAMQGPSELAAALRVADKNLSRAVRTGVRVTDPRTIQGATVCVDALVALGLVLPADRDARLGAVLAPPTPAEIQPAT